MLEHSFRYFKPVLFSGVFAIGFAVVCLTTNSIFAANDDPTSRAGAPNPATQNAKDLKEFEGCVLSGMNAVANSTVTHASQEFQTMSFPAFHRTANSAANRVRGFLGRSNTQFPVGTCEDGTIPRIMVVVDEKLGVKNPKTATTDTDDASAMEEIEQIIERAKSFKHDIQELQIQNADESMEAEALKFWIGKANANRNYAQVTFEIPKALSIQEDGQVVFSGEQRSLTFRSKNDMEKRLAQLETRIQARTEPPTWRSGWGLVPDDELSQRALEQVVLLNQLGTLRTLILQHNNANGGAPLPDDLNRLVTSIGDMYDPPLTSKTWGLIGAHGPQYNAEYKAPTWAWYIFHYQQTWKGLKMKFVYTLPKFKSDAQKTAFIELVKNMPEEKRDALGLDEVNGKISFFGRTRLLTYLMGTGALGVGSAGTVKIGPLIIGLFKYAVGVVAERRECANKASDNDFNKCRNALAEEEFGHKFNANDPKVRKFYAKLGEMHEERLHAKNAKSDQEALEQSITDQANAETMGSASFINKLINAPDADFKAGLLGTKGDLTDSLLNYEHPGEFPSYQDRVREILAKPLGSQAQIQLLQELQNEHSPPGTPLAADLQMLLEKHANAVNRPPGP